MASNEKPNGDDDLTIPIGEKLNEMLRILEERREQLKQEMNSRRDEHKKSKTDKEKSLKEAEKLKSEISFEQNSNHTLQNEIFASIEAQINTIKIERDSVFDWEFVHPSREDFIRYVTEAFTIDKKDKFKVQQKASLVVGERLLNGPMKLTLDKWTNQIYIPDALNRRIQIYSPEFKALRVFGFGPLNFPCSVDLDDTYCYVADSAGRAIHQFSRRDFKLTRSQKDTIGSDFKSLSLPVDIKVNFKSLYVADLDHNRICVFTDTLAYSKSFGQNILLKPQYVQFYDNKIYVLDGGEKFFLHVFNEHLNIHQQYVGKGINYSIVNPKSFCFSPNFKKIIVADFDANFIKVLEMREDRLIQKDKIGKDGSGGEVIDGCMGVIIVGDKIVVSCQKPSCLKVF